MDLIIPTYGRSANQETLKQLLKAGLKPILVVQAREMDLYDQYLDRGIEVRVLPGHINTIAPTRQFIVDHVGEHDKMCMIDDDLVFYKRRDDEKTKLREIELWELADAFSLMRLELRRIPHIGFAAREGANRNTESFVFNTRIMRVLGYDRDVLISEHIQFDQMEVMEDFHVALSLLEKGYENLVLNEFAHNQAGSGKEGGCSHFRTKQLQAENAAKLVALHPGFVRLVQKTTKGAWGGGTRTDVQVQWKRAFQSSQE